MHSTLVFIARFGLLALLLCGVSARLRAEAVAPANELRATELTAAPADTTRIAAHGRALLAFSAGGVRALPAGADAAVVPLWPGREVASGGAPALASSADGVFVVSGAAVAQVTRSGAEVRVAALPDLPRAAGEPTLVTVLADRLYVGGPEAFWSLDLKRPRASWLELPPLPVAVSTSSRLIGQLEHVVLFTDETTRVFQPNSGWVDRAVAPAPFALAQDAAATRYGAAHVFFFAPDGVHAYHLPTETWTLYPLEVPEVRDAAVAGEVVVALNDAGRLTEISVLPLKTGYGWLDHTVVGIYLVAMVLMSLWFARRKQSENDYFRGGNRIPWWVSGMSLFATFASAISLMSMPGKSFSSDWTYFSQGLFGLLVLPIALFVMVPFVRRLRIPTANAYLERRFGLTARLMGSVIGIFTTSLARQGSVLVLPSIALSTVMGVSVEVCILVMGLVTLAYTFSGGLSAVVWTDTVQAFIMIGAVVGCLLLAWSRVDLPAAEAWGVLKEADKLVVFDWNWSILYPTSWIFLITAVVGVLGGITSQDFIQRVQCTPNQKDAQRAVATQLMVAVPLNILLFGLGTVLFLFYRENPESLSPALKLDGIYPFFVAQQLPAGVSGIVVAALLAATMSTISSCNCSVSDIVTQDFYKRFRPGVGDAAVVRFGRLVTLASGLLGMGTALWMANATMGSIWDLAILVTNLIGNGIVGLFSLGLLTKRAHQTGALIGLLSGMAVVFWLQKNGVMTFWLFTAVGTTVTFSVGYLASLVVPGRVPPLDGLTLFTMPKGERAGEAPAK